MLKLLGAFLVIAACAAGGMLASKSLERRCRILRGLQEGLLALKREISFSNSRLSQAMAAAAVSAGQSYELFQLTGEKLTEGQGISAGEAWQEALKEFAFDTVLEREELEVLQSFGVGLGLSDINDQINRLELCRQRLESIEKNAELQWQKLGKVWRNLGWSLGIVLALLFL